MSNQTSQSETKHTPLAASDLISAVGNDVVGIQNLDTCGISLDWSAKRGTRITFGTDAKISPGGTTEKMGLIVWMPRDRVAKVLDDHKANSLPDPSAHTESVKMLAEMYKAMVWAMEHDTKLSPEEWRRARSALTAYQQSVGGANA